jgi:hypothetical protein
LIVLAAGCADSMAPPAERAALPIESSDLVLVVERQRAHRFLAEYERFLVLEANGLEIIRIPLMMDTGGYPLVNVYRRGLSEFVITDGRDDFMLRVNERTIRKTSNYPDQISYVGAFDVDDRGWWRFVAADERPERSPTEPSASDG